MSTYNNHKSTATIIATTTAVAVAVAYYIYKIKNDNKNNKKTKSKCPFSFNNNNNNNNAAAAVTSYPDAAKAIATTVTDKDGSSSSSSTTTTTVVIITNLTNPRSSIGMSLPNELSTKTINMIVATAPVVAPNMLDITKCFYGKVLPKHPGLLQWFNPAHNVPNSDHQPKALAGACIAYATNITDLTPLLVDGGPVAAICHRHAALAVFPGQYVVVHDNLMEAIGDILGDVVTPDIAAAWSEAVLFLAKAMIDTEESLYKMAEQRSGGWSGFAEFVVSEINDLTHDVKQISFKPPVGGVLEGSKFEFTPGQYLSLQIDMDGDNRSAPRHYTVTSPVNADYLQCTMKKIPGGKLSTYVHEQLKVGDKVTLSAPFGVFVEPETEMTSTVLMSAGIGVTPMVNLYRSKKTDVKLIVHVDRTPASHPYKGYFNDTGIDTMYKYTKVGGRPVVSELIAETLAKAGKDNEFYICGPEKWMEDIQKELLANGAKKVICEVFGSQLATGCPFFAGN